MKTLLKTLIINGLAIISMLQANTLIKVFHINEDVANIKTSSSVWDNAHTSLINVYPQTTIKLNDKKANALNKNNVAKTIEVKALSDGKSIAFKIMWPDSTQNIQDGTSNVHYADGFAVQFASNYSDVTMLPYIGMGSKNRPVVVYLQKAISKSYEPNGKGKVYHQINRSNAHAFNSEINNALKKFDEKVEALAVRDYQRAFVSEGFRSMTQIKDHSTVFNAHMNYEEKWFGSNEWQGSISRSLKDDYLNITKQPFPVSFAIWDGNKMGRDGLKHLSTWITVDMGDNKAAQTFDAKINKILTQTDIEKGAKLTKTNCASCHNYGQTNMAASPYMAPNLSNIGGYSTTAYLKESIITPSAVIVPGYNPNAHSSFAWYYPDGQGGRISAMPSFSHLSEEEVHHMVAFLKSLKAKTQQEK
jgi:complex iron-sulfur molybdoenzyme family reductase subunit gamma